MKLLASSDTSRAEAFSEALSEARSAYFAGQTAQAFAWLERAHVLGQPELLRHWRVHLWMLRVALRRYDGREIAGQLLRIFLTPIGHLTGRLPRGNTGGSNVSAFAPMALPDDLALYFRD
jgi:hypothetical protein